MLSIHSQDFQPQPYYLPYRTPSSSSPAHHRQQVQPDLPFFNFMAMGSPTIVDSHSHSHAQQHSHRAAPAAPSQDASVAQALEIARESPDGASDPTISKILESALAQIWGKVQAQPDSYVMTRDEFAVFNFFQHRFAGDKTAVSARKRYWDNARA